MDVQEVECDLTSYLRDRFGHPDRTEGLHLSHIYGDLSAAIKKQRGDISEADLDEFAQVGFLWERVLERTLADVAFSDHPERYVRIGEITSTEGIIMTPDYIDLDFRGNDTHLMGLEEWKATWVSCRKGDDLVKNHWKWLVQIKGYCRELGTNVARLRALYLVGNWRDRIVPTLRCWEFEFTDRELQDNWEMLTGHARRKGWL